jgi:hypothetical protein
VIEADGLPEFLAGVKVAFAEGARPSEIVGPFGTHGVCYGEEDETIFASVGFVLGEVGVYAEIEDGTFGELQAFRFAVGAGWTCEECGEACEGERVSGDHGTDCSLHSANAVG